MPALKGLPGTDGREIEGEFVGSVSAALRVLSKGKPAIFAAENGSINIWRDDSGRLRGERHFYKLVRESKRFYSQAALAVWLKSAIKKIR